MNEIAGMLGFKSPPKGVGSSVHNDFVWPLVDALGLNRQANKYRNMQAVIERLGGTYDPNSDTSESAESGGGGTIQNDGLRKVRDLLLASGFGGDQPSADKGQREFDLNFSERNVLSTTRGEELVAWDDNYVELDPEFIEDERTRQVREIVERQGQAKWRADLLVIYGGSCAVTGWDVPAGIEAAHIVPYSGDLTNEVRNGLVLRRDVHTLFDRGLLTISPECVVRVSSSLLSTSAWALNDLPARIPPEEQGGASRRLLAWHEQEVFRP